MPSSRAPVPLRRSPARQPAAWLLVACGLAGCASPAPAPQLYALHLAPRPAAMDQPAAPPALATGAWQLMTMRLPEYLDRDALLLPQAGGSLQALAGHRWAEPLRDAVPRLLGEDLGRLRGAAGLWTAPPPAGVAIVRQLRVDLLALDVLPGLAAVRLQARWSLTDPAARSPATLGRADIETASTGPGPAALVAAQRAALWQLALRIAAEAREAAAP